MQLINSELAQNKVSIFDIDKHTRRAVHHLGESIGKTYEIFKIFIWGDFLNLRNDTDHFIQIAVILTGQPRKGLLDADANIIKCGYEVSALHNVKFSIITFFQSEFEMPRLFNRPDLIRNITSQGVEIYCMQEEMKEKETDREEA